MTRPPNILFLFSDQHNPFFMGNAGHSFVVTPSLDRLAATGTRFTNAYTPNPICVPARYAMLSGQYSRETLVYHNNHIPCSELPSFAQVLCEAGWRPDWQGCMIRWRNWKYCWYLDGAAELYDLEADPNETVNLVAIGHVASVRDDLHGRLTAFWQPEQQERRCQALPSLVHNKGAEIAMQWPQHDGRWVDAWP